jgi:hypothetical protein
MTEPSPSNAELMWSLRRLVKGLSLLFWGLPITLLVCVTSPVNEWLRDMGVIPPVAATGLLLFGLRETGRFQRDERHWRESVELTRLFAVVNVGLSPFVFLWGRLPHPFFLQALGLLALSSLLFLVCLNRALQRLAALLPDETLREETRMFSTLNLWLMVGVLGLLSLYFGLRDVQELPGPVLFLLEIFSRQRWFLLLFLALLPLAITMTMIWKIKEAVLAGVFHQQAER